MSLKQVRFSKSYITLKSKQLFSLEVLFLEILTWYSPLLGFDDVLDILERLTPLDFCLPEDLAIRHLTRANEAFGDNY